MGPFLENPGDCSGSKYSNINLKNKCASPSKQTDLFLLLLLPDSFIKFLSLHRTISTSISNMNDNRFRGPLTIGTLENGPQAPVVQRLDSNIYCGINRYPSVDSCQKKSVALSTG